MSSLMSGMVVAGALPRAQREARRRERWRRAGLYAATIALMLLVMFPFLWMVQMSFRPNDDIFGYDLLFTPTLVHYGALWQGHFAGSFGNELHRMADSAVSELARYAAGLPFAHPVRRADLDRIA